LFTSTLASTQMFGIKVGGSSAFNLAKARLNSLKQDWRLTKAENWTYQTGRRV